MKPKKTKKADLEGKKFIFTQIGLVIALLAVFAAFSSKSYDKREVTEHARMVDDTPEEMVPITEHKPPPPPPPPPPQQAIVLDVVEDDVEVEEEIEIDAEADQETIVEEIAPVEEEEEVGEAEIFTVVEDDPEFPGGMVKLMNYLGSNIKYPVMAKEAGIQGRVFLNFVVEPTGKISNIRILRGIGGGCDEEALRVVEKMPKWKPGKQRGKAVRVSFNLPVKFTLQ